MKVPGVIDANVSLEKAEAQVTFDPDKTNARALIRATAAAGHPSRVKGR